MNNSLISCSRLRLLFVILCLGTGSIAAQSHRLHGVVKDAKTGERLPNALVMIKGTTVGAKSNLEGFFVLQNVPDTQYVLQARYVGYEVMELTIDPAKDPENLSISMVQHDIVLEGVTVVSQESTILKTEPETSLQTVSARQLSTLPSAGQADIFRSMQLLPGVSGTNDRSSGLYVRGGTPDQNLVLFDGMTVYHVDHFFGFFSAFNPDAVKDVQFYKGGFPAQYGGRLSSVVDMVGKSGDPDNSHFSAGINLLSANALLELPLSDKISFLVAGRRSYSEVMSTGAYTSLYNFLSGSSSSNNGRRGVFGGGGGGRRGNAFSTQQTPTPMFYDLDSKLTYTIGPDDIAAVSFYNSMDDLDKSQQASTQSFGNSNFQFSLPSTTDDTKQGNMGGSAKWFHQWSNTLFSNVVLATAKYSSAYHFEVTRVNPNSNNQNSQSTNEDNSINDNTFRLDNTWILDRSHEVDFGTEISIIKVNYSLSATTIFSQAQANLLNLDQQVTESAFYLQDKWKPFETLDVILGVRGMNYSLLNQTYVEPRVSWRYALSENLSLKGAYGIYHQFTNRIINEDLTQGSRDFWVLAQNNLQPGKAEHYILGATLENQEYVADVEVYYKVLGNLVEFSQRFRRTADDLYRFFSGSGIAKGIEVLLQKKQGALNGWISYTLGKAEDTFADFNNGNPFPASQDQTHELKIVGTLSLGGSWAISSDFIYGSGTPYTSPTSQYSITMLDNTVFQYTHVSDKNAFRLPSYQRLDLSISKRFGDETSSHWLVGLSAFNLLNHKNIAYYQYDLNSNPVHITEVTGLGITPTIFVQVDFR